MKTLIAVTICLLTTAAGQQGGSHAAEFMKRMHASMTAMEQDMTAGPMNGNVDHDFAVMMMPHHKGAIDMAEAELTYGKDRVMRRLAQEIVIDQQSEIEVMHLWLSKGKKEKQ